uniref:Small ribosomal subunit protein uS5 n=1 Tax=Papio anubis TaxID=9555 RepID=A0A2I3MWX8_PAPAN
MADDAGAAGGPGGPGGPGMGNRGGFRGGFSSGIRGRGRGRGWGRGRGRGARGGKAEDKEWMPVTKLGLLVKDMKIKSLEEIYLFSLPIKESEIIDFFLRVSLKDKVLKIMPVQKQTHAGQRTRFKAFVAIGDYNGHVGLGVKCSKEVATAIRGAIILAKLSIVPVRRGYWGNKIGKPHTVPCKSCRELPYPRPCPSWSSPCEVTEQGMGIKVWPFWPTMGNTDGLCMFQRSPWIG